MYADSDELELEPVSAVKWNHPVQLEWFDLQVVDANVFQINRDNVEMCGAVLCPTKLVPVQDRTSLEAVLSLRIELEKENKFTWLRVWLQVSDLIEGFKET